MFTFIKYIYNNLKHQPPILSCREEIERINAEIDKLYAAQEVSLDINKSEDSYIPGGIFFTSQGTISHLYANDGYIDETLYFSREMARNLDIQIGFIVEYMARKISEEVPVKIYLITSIVRESWENEFNDSFKRLVESNPKVVSTHEKILSGNVIAKNDGSVIIKPSLEQKELYEVKLSEIECTFIPMVGDDVSLLTLYQTDSGVLNYSGKAIGVYSISPAISKVYAGKIEKFPKRGGREYGVIDREYIFYCDALQHFDNLDSKLDVGDSVIAEVIASHRKVDFKSYDWRCIKIIKNTERSDKKSLPNCYEINTIDENINGIWITERNDLKLSFSNLNEKKMISITVKNSSDRVHKITGASVNEKMVSSQIDCPKLFETHAIQPNAEFNYEIQVTAKLYGISRFRIVFSFEDSFTLSRCIEIDVEGCKSIINTTDVADHKINRNKDYTKQVWNKGSDAVPGVNLKSIPHFVDKRLKPFDVPESLKNTVLDNANNNEIDERLTEILPSYDRLDFSNYKRCFHGFLHLEEIYLKRVFGKYDRDRAHFVREGEYLALHIQNVSESRPSIIASDMVIAEDPWQNNNDEENASFSRDNRGTGYQGIIHKVKKNRLLIKFNDNFHQKYNGEDYRLYFKFSRSNFIKQHNAIEKINDSEILFPLKVKMNSLLQLDVSLIDDELVLNYRNQKIPWYNPELNTVQKKAIECILRGETRPMPYIIFGPPGTGKTLTVVELILQLFKRVGGSRILVAAPSNSAANLITKRLVDCKALVLGQFVRIVSYNSIEREQIPDELHPYCATVDIAAPSSTKDNRFITNSGLSLNSNSVTLTTYRIIISTCTSFGNLLCMKFPRNHFSHVIIDEAGQCLESEAIIPISLLSQKGSQIILAGDPMQLGPIINSQFAKKRGMGKSFLVRLLERVPYMRGFGSNDTTYNSCLVTKLLYSYRALPSILSSYNNLFYQSELIATISEFENSKELALLNRLKKNNIIHQANEKPNNYGIFFFGIRGREEQIVESTSWRNPSETSAIFDMVTSLLSLGLDHTDIGIITPYTLQVKDIRDLCNNLNVELPKIGSVEEFQGQERNIILISTVRSNIKNMEMDKKYNLGFIQDARRMNVAISRAKAVLMIFGNPDLLIADRNWRELIRNCSKNGTYSGCDLPANLLK